MASTMFHPKQSINKAYLKVKPNRSAIESFKTHLSTLLDRSNDTESEEFHKNLISEFLKKTYYDPNHFVNTKGRNDLVIYNGNSAKSTVGVIIEAKKPGNKAEMVSKERLNAKAFQELVLYYLRERITEKNLEVKHLIITNVYEWFIFDAVLFDRLFAQNKTLVHQFNEFEAGRLSDTKTDFFYKQIAEPFINGIKSEIEFTYFNFQDYTEPLRNKDKSDDNRLIALFKILSPEHLLKLPFSNDSNSLDKRFYAELLHIIGLTEVKDGSKKLIDRNKKGERNSGTLLEDAIIQLDSLDKLSRIDKPSQYGETTEERLFNIALELSITWINRILFLKLLEAQLLSYHKGDALYAFLNYKRIKTYDDLNSLFFQVLAKSYEERNDDVKQAFAHVPYLNSSLFEPSDIEQTTLFISNLKDDKTIPVHSQTVLKDQSGKKRTGSLNTLEYLFEFLNAYDFSSEGSEEIQEDNKTLINASVLGLIFEKINGYKDGSFFTPGFITMYMCRETIRKAVVQKFNEVKGWKCESIDELYDKIEDRNEANQIVNSLKICDPAVGSGHFLVSALNEIIALKSDLKILQDREGKRLKEYHVEVVNDELIVTDEEAELFEYNPKNKESQRVQETLFHEKQTIIENCLFGVDINPNSVKICRLRLWIELLKNAYYTTSPSSPPFQGGVLEEGGGFSNFSSRAGVPVGGGGNSLPENSGKLNNLPYLKTFRKELRNNATPAEASLWTLLKGKSLGGKKFRRQHSFGNYILDFYCPEERIAIELDGQGHFEASQAEYDRERDLFLEYFGIKVLRFENKVVWENPEGLLESVRSNFGWRNNHPDSSSHPSSSGGELKGELNSSGGEFKGWGLQTLPNIDINIKCGNSLVSRFALDADLKDALKKSKWTIESYRMAVDRYRNAESKTEKREMERLIKDIKSDFRSEISMNDPKAKRLRKLSGDLFQLTNQQQLFELSAKEKAAWNKKVKDTSDDIEKLEKEIEEIKSNKIYENAFEWRFEFPEVLNDEGDFVGFDVVIGNPPYIRQEEFSGLKDYLKSRFKIYNSISDLLTYFVEQAYDILREKGQFQFIISNKFSGVPVFDEATVDAAILGFQKQHCKQETTFTYANILKEELNIQEFNEYLNRTKVQIPQNSLTENTWSFSNNEVLSIKVKVENQGIPLKDWNLSINYGIKTGLNEAFIITDELKRNIETHNPESIQLLQRILRGRDIQKWNADYNNLWLINIPKGYTIKTKLNISNINISEPPPRYGYVEYDEAWDWFKSTHPLIANHIFSFRKKANERSDMGDYWWEQRACAYLDDFKKAKIIYPNMTKFLPFVIDVDNHYLHNDKSFHIVTENIYWLGAFLNSKLFKYCFKDNFPELLGGTRELRKVFFDKIPIKQISTIQEKPFETLVKKILSLSKGQHDYELVKLEKEIDQLVYQLYELTEEEIKIVEGE
jgi:very-short-patch-repair endonuclease